MLRKLRKIQGQSTLEYALLIVIVLAMLLSLQAYMKRGATQSIKQSIDDLSGGKQFSPNNTRYTKTTTSGSDTRETVQTGVTASTMQQPDLTVETETQNIVDVGTERWDR